MKKQFYSKLLFLFALLLTVSTSAWAEDVTYTISAKNTLTTTGTAPSESSATIAETYGTSKQMTSGNSQTLTLTGYDGYTISAITLSMKSNASKGGGKLSYSTDGGSTFTYLVGSASAGVAFSDAAWNGAYTTTYTDVTKSDLSIACGEDNVIFKIEAITNSLYCESYTITYAETPSSGKADSDFALVDAPITLNFDLYNNSTARVISYTSSSTGEVTIAENDYIDTDIDADNKTITVTPKEKTPSSQIITVRQAADDTYNAGETTFTVSIDDSTPKTGKWELTNLTDLTADDVFVIVGNNGSNYAMSNDNGTTSAPSAVDVTINNDEITSDVDDNIKWNISGNATEGYTFYPAGTTLTWLYCTNANNGVRVGTNNDNNIFTISNDYLYNTATTRYLGIYNSQDWRCYTSIHDNIKGQTFAFFKYVSLSPLASIEVTGAPTTFHKGDVFSHEGAVVTATYEDGTTKIVTGKAKFTGYDMSAEGEQTVTVSYTEGEVTETDTYTINVAAPAVLTGITLSGEYPVLYVGDEFSHVGIEVTASYDDNTTKDVTASATFSTPDMTTVGEQTVTVSYTEGEVTKTATYDITLSLKPGTKALPYTVAQACAAIDANVGLTEDYYVKGIISQVDSYSDQYSSITYWISEDGTTTNQLQVYSGMGLAGAKFSRLEEVQVGDKVVVSGKLKKFNDIYEFNYNNQLVSLERANFITDAANATWVAPAKVKVLSEGVTVYTVTYDDAVPCTRKHKVDDKVIPANEAVLLTSNSKGEATTVKIEVTDDEAADFAALDNDLLGSDGTRKGGANIFCLAVGDKGLGFYPVSDEIYVPAGKAYLLIPATQGAPSYLWFNGDTTAIDSLTTDTAAGNESGEIYSLTGQRVGKNYRGIVIMNGRKVLKK